MTRKILAATAALVCTSTTVWADAPITEISSDVYCTASRTNHDTLQIYLHITDFKQSSTKNATVTYSMTMTEISPDSETGEYLGGFSTGGFTGVEVPNDPNYNGTKYVNHLRFPIKSGPRSKSGALTFERANLIFSPAYTVVRTVKSGNHWDKKWTWEVETRKHSAVLELNLNDHHGDYVPLECFSSGQVNEVRGSKFKVEAP